MTDKVIVLSTCASAEEGERIARRLVERQLAACVNISSPVRSLYRWKGKVADDQEVLLVIKTSRALFDRVRREVEKVHTYEVPEVICLPVVDGAPNYLNWIGTSLRAAPTPEPIPPPARRPPAPRPERRKKKK